METSSRYISAPPRKRFKSSVMAMEKRVATQEEEDCRDGCPQREDFSRRDSVSSSAASSIVGSSAVGAPAADSSSSSPRSPPTAKATKGIILRSGRIRLPDKLIQYLDNEVTPSLFWQPDGQGFSIDCDRIQTELLDKYFDGTKLSSFLRSLNRWGFKRLFYHSMPKSTLSFHHPMFRRGKVGLCKDMNMAAPSSCSSTLGSAGGGGGGTTAQTNKRKAKKAPKVEVNSRKAPPPPPSKDAASATLPPTPPTSSSAPVAIASNSHLLPPMPTVTAGVAAPIAVAAGGLITQPQHPATSLMIQPALTVQSLQLQSAAGQSSNASATAAPATSLTIQPALTVQPMQIPLAAAAPAAPAALTATNPSLQTLIEQARAQAAVRQALVAAEQQRCVLQNCSALLSCAANTNTNTRSSNPLGLLEGIISSLVTGGGGGPGPQQQQQQQQVAAPTVTNHQQQLLAVAAALSSTGTSAPRVAPVPAVAAAPPPPPPAPQPQAVPSATLLQLLTPAQQIDVINRLASNANK